MINDLFESIFQGEYVEIIQGIDMAKEGPIPVAIYGYVLDTDDKFIFIGDSPHEINKAILKSSIKIISITTPRTEEDDLLDSIPEPNREEDFN